MIFQLLLLSHLLADFPLQTKKLVEFKHQSILGGFAHIFIHFVVTSAILFIYLGTELAFYLALLLSLIHLIIDYAKIYLENFWRRYQITYWLDQAAHLISIIFVTSLSEFYLHSQTLSISAIHLTNLLILIIFSTYTIEYGILQNLRTKELTHPRDKKLHQTVKNFSPASRRSLSRLMLLSLIYTSAIILLTSL